MSDILIKNMKMPQACSQCNFCQGFECIALKRTFNLISKDDCPLVEVPTPHGRLIDADRLVRELKNIMSEDDPRFAELMYIVGQPTIIEAEK